MEASHSVPGRSLPFDQLLAMYQQRTQPQRQSLRLMEWTRKCSKYTGPNPNTDKREWNLIE